MRLGSIFSGVGGFDIAAERAGMDVAWQSEVDKHASRVLEHHWPGKNLGDIHGIVSPEPVNVLAGGFPCQSYSIAGNRGGLAEDRGALWWEYHRLIDGLGPEWVVAENVPGLLSSNGGRDFTTIIKSLVQLGYGVVWRVLDAQYFGVPQRRRRVFIVGHSGGQPRPEILALSEGLCGDTPPSRHPGQDDTGTPARSVGGAGESDAGRLTPYRQLSLGQYVQDDQASTVMQRDYKSSTDLVVIMRNREGKPGGADVDQACAELLQPAGYHIQAELIGRNPEAGPNGAGIRSFDEAPAYTLNIAGGVQGVAVMRGKRTQVRRLTSLETERLQGFPDGHTDIEGNSDSQRYRQMGNAVAVPVAEWVLRRVVEHGE